MNFFRKESPTDGHNFDMLADDFGPGPNEFGAKTASNFLVHQKTEAVLAYNKIVKNQSEN